MSYIRSKRDLLAFLEAGGALLLTLAPDEENARHWSDAHGNDTISYRLAEEAVFVQAIVPCSDGLFPGMAQTYVANPSRLNALWKKKKIERVMQAAPAEEAVA